MANTLGKVFSVSNFGESHGKVIGVLIDGCPAGLPLSELDFQADLARRQPGHGSLVTVRSEPDMVEIWTGTFAGHTTGAPLCLVIKNTDVDSAIYEDLRFIPRPSHADYTSFVKYGGWGDYRGGGRFSGRLTAGFVMAGVVAKKLLATFGINVMAYTVEIGGIKAEVPAPEYLTESMLRNPLSCPEPAAAEKMAAAISSVRKSGDSLGGIIEVIAHGVPAGLGEPIADTLDGELAKAFFAIPGVKGVEFGAGFETARLKGSENNDAFVIKNNRVQAATNRAGGVLGGIASGMPITARVAIKPTPSISRPQHTVNLKTMDETEVNIGGRHDPCIVPRAVVVVEAMTAIILCDFSVRASLIPGVLK